MSRGPLSRGGTEERAEKKEGYEEAGFLALTS